MTGDSVILMLNVEFDNFIVLIKESSFPFRKHTLKYLEVKGHYVFNLLSNGLETV